MRMLPSRITHIECAAFLLIIVQEDSLPAVLVLEVASIDVGEGLLVNLWRYATGFFMMIGDLIKLLVTHQILIVLQFRLCQFILQRPHVAVPLTMRLNLLCPRITSPTHF